MALTSVGAIYATQSKLLQRVYIPSHDDSEINQQHVGAGETLLLVPIATYQISGSAGVQSTIGAPTFSGRCAVVDGTNTVIDHIIADPALYTDPRGQVIAHDTSAIGDHWTGTIFTRSFAEFSPSIGIVSNISVQNIDAATVVTAGNRLYSMPPGSLLVVNNKIPRFGGTIA